MTRVNPINEQISENVRVSKYSKDEWIIVECPQTGMIYLQNPPDYSQLVDEFAWEKQFSDEKTRRKSQQPVMSFLSESIKKVRGIFRKKEKIETVTEQVLANIYKQTSKPVLNVVDIGCGTGMKLLNIASTIEQQFSFKIKPIGIELSQVQAQEAGAHLAPVNGECIHDFAINGLAQLPDESVDCMILCSFLEHEKSPLPLLKLCKEKLSPDGVIIIKVPNYNSWNRLLRQGQWCGFRYPDHVNYFTPNTLTTIVNNAGLKISKLEALPISDNMWAFVDV